MKSKIHNSFVLELTLAELYSIYRIDQYFFISKIGQTLSNVEFSNLALKRVKIEWKVNARPAIFLIIEQIAEISKAVYDKDITKHSKRLNRESNTKLAIRDQLKLLILSPAH